MKTFQWKRVFSAAAVMGALFFASAMHQTMAQTLDAAGQKWPSRTIKIRVGFPPGGTTDVLSRIVGQKLTESLGVAVIIENKPGAVGSLDAGVFAKAPLDDHSFLMVPPGVQAINQFLYKSVDYDPDRDFVTVGLVAQCPNVLAVHPSMPFTTFQEFVSYAKENPTKLNYSISGVGASGHLLNELMKNKTGIQMQHVPYKGNGPALQALISGQVQVNTDCNPQLMQYIRAGKVRALAVSSEGRWSLMPELPTFAELGYPDLSMKVWYALLGQPTLPKEIITRMNRELNAIVTQPDMVSRMRDMNLEPMHSTPQEAAAFVVRERARWKEMVRISGARID